MKRVTENLLIALVIAFTSCCEALDMATKYVYEQCKKSGKKDGME